MTIIEFFATIASTLGITAAGIWALGDKWAAHQFSKNLEDHKGKIKLDIEDRLDAKAAQRSYEFEGRKRLYHTIGPLRFQLLLAARDLAHHIQTHGLDGYEYDLVPSNYYGASTLFRIVRPLAISELIEVQMTYADFSIDPEAVDLLRFKRSIYEALTDKNPIFDHPKADWDNQKEHVFSQSLGIIAHSVLISEENKADRVMRFHEFSQFISNPGNLASLQPLPDQLTQFSISKMPLFWIRLVCVGHICAEFVNTLGTKAGFANIAYKHRKLLELAEDDYIQEHLGDILDVQEKLVHRGL